MVGVVHGGEEVAQHTGGGACGAMWPGSNGKLLGGSGTPGGSAGAGGKAAGGTPGAATGGAGYLGAGGGAVFGAVGTPETAASFRDSAKVLTVPTLDAPETPEL